MQQTQTNVAAAHFAALVPLAQVVLAQGFQSKEAL